MFFKTYYTFTIKQLKCNEDGENCNMLLEIFGLIILIIKLLMVCFISVFKI